VHNQHECRLALPKAFLIGVLGIAVLLCLAFTIAPTTWSVADQGNAKGSTTLVAAQADTPDKLAAARSDALSKVSLKVRPYVQDKGWKKWVNAGKKAGTTSKGLRGVRIKLTGLGNGVTGSIKYRTYDKGKGWGKTVKNGKSSGRTSTPVQAVKIWLTGSLANHYDVLYRVYVKGQGWQPWVKNKAKSGITKKDAYACAVQVKLSPKTEDAIGRANAVGVRYEARLKDTGWLMWAGDGRTAGKAAKNKVIDGFVLALDAGTIGGGVEYRAYIQGQRWSQGWKKSGRTVGVKGKRIEGLQFKLTGNIASKYDIYYRTYIYGEGWLGWAKNGAASGGPGAKLPIAAVQIKLMAKGAPAPSSNGRKAAVAGPSRLDGIDISSWQPDININKVDADFVIVKATGGKGYTNPYFQLQANATLKSGKLLGLYHFARERSCSGTAIQEADYFVKAAGPYIGRAVLVLDWEADALLLGPGWAKKFLDRVYKKTGVKPLIYMSKSRIHSYDWNAVAANYKLWVAQYPNYNKPGYQSDPWTDASSFGPWGTPTIFQYASTGRISGYGGDLDLNLFYGDSAAWKALAAKS